MTKPESTASWIEPRFAALTVGIVALIVYGSLFPFEFYDRGGLGDAARHLLSTPLVSSDRGDVLSNILLYLPLGLFGARALEKLSGGARVLIMAIACGALSTGIELTQFFDLSRASELSDVTANLAGGAAGAAIEIAVRDRLRRVKWEPFAILLIVAQLGVWLYPYVPSAGAVFEFDALGIYKQTVFWLAIAMLTETLAGVARARIALPAMAAFVIAARFAIGDAAMTGSDVAGAILGVAGWFALSKVPARARIVAALFTGFVIVDSLRPFSFLPSPRQFEWTPFLSFIDGPRGSASRVFLEKTFTYGSLLWLATRSGLTWLPATLSATGLVMALRLTQVWLPERSAEITDALMVLILAGVMKVLAR